MIRSRNWHLRFESPKRQYQELLSILWITITLNVLGQIRPVMWAKAQFGWYRYNTRFGIPVYDEDGNLERYNIFSTRKLVRCDADGKLYLYDLVRTKKETSKPHEQ